MTRVHVLTAGPGSPNGRAFLFPLIAHSQAIAAAGIELRIFRHNEDGIADCDIVIIDSKYFSPRWQRGAALVIDEIGALRASNARIFWFDITDSSGWDHARALPHVDVWLKNQVLRDRSRYLEPIYGAGRLYADFAHRQHGVNDESPLWSEPVADATQIDKIHVGWNSGLADYSLYGPFRMALYSRLPLPRLLTFPSVPYNAGAERPVAVASRFGNSYPRASVRWQRQQVAKLTERYTEARKLDRRRYLRELAHAKVSVSPFGLGEITLKDFETFLAGALLFKPDMSHLETWPDFFRPGETCVTHTWDFSDFSAQLEASLQDDKQRQAIAARGQDLYRRHLSGAEAPVLFCDHFSRLLKLGKRAE
jgi:hypothetical protein